MPKTFYGKMALLIAGGVLLYLSAVEIRATTSSVGGANVQPNASTTASSTPDTAMTYGELARILVSEPKSIARLVFVKKAPLNLVEDVIVYRREGEPLTVVIPGDAASASLLQLATKANIPVEAQAQVESSFSWAFVFNLLFIGILIYGVSKMMKGSKNSNEREQKLVRSGAQIAAASDKKSFYDVAGCDEAKQELQEIVNHLLNPGLLSELGGKSPKGVLLVGSPGNGKTLLAKAVAGEANAAFFSISASQFVEMFVGVGAARVRDLFEKARANKPAIIFIDEIDAVGRQRGTGLGGGHDEREQTLNQLLVEMDGFVTNDSVVVMAATNRPDILDPALIRPGRFDLQVSVDSPDLLGRLRILQLHTRRKKLAANVDLEVIAARTPGFSGAELEGVTNQAAIVAARRIEAERAELKRQARPNKIQLPSALVITMADLDEGIDRVQMGPAKESRAKAMTAADLRNTAYHEVGHAYISQVMHNENRGGDPVVKVTIVSRARALGYTQALPRGERWNYTKEELRARIMMAMGGRAAQELFLNTVDTGAGNDFQQATNIARQMVTKYGMSELGPISVGDQSPDPFLGRAMAQDQGVSAELQGKIDEAWMKIIDDCLQETKRILQEDAQCFARIVDILLAQETILGQQWEELFNQNSCRVKAEAR